MRDAGATEVYLLIASPPTISPCFYGVDTPKKDHLIASNHSVQEIAKIIGADGVFYISINGLYKAINKKERNNDNPQYCDACFSNQYPIPLIDKEGSELPLFEFYQ